MLDFVPGYSKVKLMTVSVPIRCRIVFRGAGVLVGVAGFGAASPWSRTRCCKVRSIGATSWGVASLSKVRASCAQIAPGAIGTGGGVESWLIRSLHRHRNHMTRAAMVIIMYSLTVTHGTPFKRRSQRVDYRGCHSATSVPGRCRSLCQSKGKKNWTEKLRRRQSEA